MCIVACPYGRFQSVMLDRHSLIVSYDPLRGEPRGKRRPAQMHPGSTAPAIAPPAMALTQLAPAAKHTCCGKCTSDPAGGTQTDDACCAGHERDAAPRTGDCVDCGVCVAVCPTGIDIRAGLQLECIGCAQCI
ncbi:4Fe-4S dicluster domain-containing protein, partial [Paenibacillus aquistagni]|uniref:4Fe-4S dicluster domain-containing protein n=1 Tax=Paenibacillus aquistagni TaxID=1852522 RepID=UPI001857D2A4|nr:cytochrome c oxidase accessory protein CcoG [Paenibacillus aquistagni]